MTDREKRDMSIELHAVKRERDVFKARAEVLERGGDPQDLSRPVAPSLQAMTDMSQRIDALEDELEQRRETVRRFDALENEVRKPKGFAAWLPTVGQGTLFQFAKQSLYPGTPGTPLFAKPGEPMSWVPLVDPHAVKFQLTKRAFARCAVETGEGIAKLKPDTSTDFLDEDLLCADVENT